MKLNIKSYGRMGDAVFDIEYNAETVGDLIDEIVKDLKENSGEVYIKWWNNRISQYEDRKLISYGCQSWVETDFLTDNLKKEKIKKVYIIGGSIYDNKRNFIIEI